MLNRLAQSLDRLEARSCLVKHHDLVKSATSKAGIWNFNFCFAVVALPLLSEIWFEPLVGEEPSMAAECNISSPDLSPRIKAAWAFRITFVSTRKDNELIGHKEFTR